MPPFRFVRGTRPMLLSIPHVGLVGCASTPSGSGPAPSGANKPYGIAGQRYPPLAADVLYIERGLAS